MAKATSRTTDQSSPKSPSTRSRNITQKNDQTSRTRATRTAKKDDSKTEELAKKGKHNKMDDTHPLEKFFMDALKDIYWAEKALTDSLPKMQKAATTEELQDAFEDHTLQTKKHVSRLEKVFSLLGKEAEAKKCEAMKGIIDECERIIDSTPEGTMTRDAALIIAAQKVEHYEIASYGGLVQLAITLGRDKVANILETTLQEEEDTDRNLTEIAETNINFAAEAETTEDTEA